MYFNINKYKLNNTKKLDEINITSYNFNAYEIKNKNILCIFAYLLFDKLFDFKNININEDKLYEFIKLVSKYYYNVHFHNFNHVIFVLQYTYLLILEIKLKNDVDDYELFALMISALVHDIDHPGYNNQFMIHTKNTIAEKYNYISVLENHHINIAFNILDKINLLTNLSSNKYNKIKAIIYSCIISTDMTNNDILINKFNNKINEGFDLNNNKMLLYSIIIHIADLSNQLRPPHISFEGSSRIHSEYLNQVLKETILGIPISEFMIVHNNQSIYQNELKFCINIVKPNIDSIIKLFPNLEHIRDNLNYNIEILEELTYNQIN
jgi:high affinity cGMP-specific 3',5'-cyclic phosphodiesterase 9